MSIHPAQRCRFVVLTKNSGRWLDVILDAYEALGIFPFVLLDASSSDGTEQLLRRRTAAFAKELPEFPRAEALIASIARHVQSEWVVRLDDDELPSRGMQQWVEEQAAADHDRAVFGFQRRWIRLAPGGVCEYSRHPLIVSRLGVLDAQWRMFRPAAVRYRSDIHTPGFFVPKGSGIAPHRAYIGHFSWLVRSASERRLQIEDYDRQEAQAGSRFRAIKVWEDCDLTEHRFRAMDTDEFDRPVAALAATFQSPACV